MQSLYRAREGKYSMLCFDEGQNSLNRWNSGTGILRARFVILEKKSDFFSSEKENWNLKKAYGCLQLEEIVHQDSQV